MDANEIKKELEKAEARTHRFMRSKRNRLFDAHRVFGDLRSEVRLPEGKSGHWQIKHNIQPPGSEQTIVSQRNALFMGFKAMKAKVEDSFIITELLEDGRRWMTDSLQEIFLHHFAIDAAKGHVLVGGLGIGYSALAMAAKHSVKSVTVVEISKHVIKLVGQHMLDHPKIEVVCADLHDFVKVCPAKFDFAFFDIWCSTGEWEYEKTVRPLRAAAKRVLKPGAKLKCWGEEEMEGQRRWNGRPI